VKQFNQATQAHPDAEWMFEKNELGHVSFPLALDILFSQQFA
jgi:hypothetical protein